MLKEEIVGEKIRVGTEKTTEIEDNKIIMTTDRKELTNKEAIWVKNKIMIIMSREEMVEKDNIVVMVNQKINIRISHLMIMTIDINI